MRKSLMIAAPVALALLALPALAGGAECDKAAKAAGQNASAKSGCNVSKEECAKMMADARTHGWLGIEYDKTESGAMKVEKVIAGSPAEKAGFQSGDVLVALNGIDFTEANHGRLKAEKKSFHAGTNATWTVKRSGFTKDLTATLATMPDAVYQAMVDEHMTDHVAVATR